MKDRYNRTIDYMRISITDRCNYHCVYCNPDKFKFLSHNDILRYEEILDICKVAVKLGIVNFKVTGGEPTVRKGYLSFLRQLKQLEGVRQVTLTTNGLLLDAHTMDELKDIGIDGINFSIDTLDSKKYASICGKDTLDTVLNNLLYGVSIGLNIKINTVVGPLFTQSDLEGLIDFCENLPVSLRFIELMPLGLNKRENKIEEVQSYFASHYNIEEITERLGNGPAHYIRIKNMKCVIGFIEALHHKFCHECNRVRLSSTGSLKLCLFHKNSIALKSYIGDEIKLEEAMRDAIYMKPEQHHFEDEQSGTVMNQIGG